VRLTKSILIEIDALARRFYLWLFYGAVVLGFLFPSAGAMLGKLDFFETSIIGIPLQLNFVTLMLATMLLAGAARCSVADFQSLLFNPRLIFVSALFILGLSPVIAIAITKALELLIPGDLSKQIGIGIMLIAAAPVTMTSAYWLNLVRGNISFATAMVTISSLLAPLSMPFILRLGIGVDATEGLPSPMDTVGLLFTSIWGPITLVMVLRRFAPKLVEATRPLLSILSTLAVLSIFYVIISTSQPIIMKQLTPWLAVLIFLTVILYSVANFALSNLFGKAFKVGRRDRITLMYMTAMRSNGTAMAVGMASIAHKYPLAVLPAAFAVFHHVVAKFVNKVLVKTATQQAKNYDRQIVSRLLVDYQIQPLEILGLILWPEEARINTTWNRANVQDISVDGIKTLSTESVPEGSVVMLRIHHSRLVFPIEVKATRLWEHQVVEGEQIFLGGLQFVNLSGEMKELLQKFLDDPIIKIEKLKKRPLAIGA
jgi:BASS family bile acid:Na+ symporter